MPPNQQQTQSSSQEIHPLKEGFYHIKIKENKRNEQQKVLSIKQINKEKHFLCETQYQKNDNSQIFYLKLNEDGFYTIFSYTLCKCLGVHYWLNETTHKQIVIDTISFDDNHKWKITQIVKENDKENKEKLYQIDLKSNFFGIGNNENDYKRNEE